jgi:hypothetical protein
MMQPISSQEELARKALDKLVQQYLHHPAVSIIDMGFDPVYSAGKRDPEVVLRLHIRPGSDVNAMHIPTQIDGIPVRIITADYHLE